MAKTKEKEEVESKDDNVKNFLSSLLKGYQDDHYNFVTNERLPVSTGSLLLDTHVKLKTGSVVRLCGPLESGKTSQALLLVDSFLKSVPNSRGLYVKAEGRLSENIQERSGMKFVFTADEWTSGSVFVLESNVFEAVADILQSTLKTMYENGEKLAFIIDSLDGLILKNDLEKTADKNYQPAGVPKMTKMLFRKIALPINKYDALAVLISQYSETFKIDPYAKDKPQPVQGVGGSAASHQPDWIFEYGVRYKSHYILEDPKGKADPITNKIIGHTVNVTLRKTANEKTGTQVCVPIKYGKVGNSIWTSREVGDTLLAWELVKQNKATYEFDKDLIKEGKVKGLEIKESMVGEGKYYKYLDENEEICNFLYEKVKSIL